MCFLWCVIIVTLSVLSRASDIWSKQQQRAEQSVHGRTDRSQEGNTYGKNGSEGENTRMCPFYIEKREELYFLQTL